MNFDRLLTKRYVLQNNAILFSISIVIIYFGKVEIVLKSLSLVNILLALVVAIITSGTFLYLSKKYKLWKKTMEWFYGGQKKDKLFNYFIFPVVVATAEELMFRVILINYFGFLISSLLFGIYHVRLSLKSVPITLGSTIMGFLLSFLYLYFGGFVSVFIAHIAFHIIVRYAIDHNL